MKENQYIEWKESWRDEYLKWICGFANAEGGIIEIGKNNRGMLTGIKNADKLMEEIPNKVRDILGIMVDVNLHEEKDKEYIEIVVDSYPYPVSYKGEYHYRSGSTKQELKGAALDKFLLKKRGKHWDGVPEPNFHISDSSPDSFRLFSQKAAHSGRMDETILNDNQETILENLELTEGNYLKRAACLLFSEKPEKYISGAWIKIGFFVTDDDLRYQDEIHGNLFEQVEKTLEILKFKYLKAYISYAGVQRLETFLFPLGALREALLNAIIHKDYSSSIPIQISVYEDQIVFWNPGELPLNWTIANLLGKHPSKPYNPLLANTFFRAGYIESWGRGIEKISRECREHDINVPEYDMSMSGMMLTFHANPKHLNNALGETDKEKVGRNNDKVGRNNYKVGRNEEKVGRNDEKVGRNEIKYDDNISDNQMQILSLLKDNPLLTARELSDEIGISSRKIEVNIAKLKRNGYIKRVGSTKGGYWEVLK